MRRAAASTFEQARAAKIAPLLIVSGISSLLATRLGLLDGRLIYNFDSPVDFFLPSAFHQALATGRLPLWSDQLALGFPLYAEGKIAAFYPPHWLIYQLPPIEAVQVALLAHLVFLGLGTGLIARRFGRHGSSAVLAAFAMPLAGGLVTKLEWTNMVEAFAWLPWILLPLFWHPRPTRKDLVLSGMAFGAQALLGHPNIWLMSGLMIVLVLVASEPRVASIRRAMVVGLIGAGVGAIQLVPTLVLIPLSVRANGLDSFEFFAYPGTIFDGLGFAFSNVYVRLAATTDLNATWYPSGGWGILEAGAYVGLPIIALATVGFRSTKTRPLILPLAVFLIGPLLWALHPEWLASVPLVDAVRRPTRAYLFVDFTLVVAAAAGLDRIRDGGLAWRRPALVVGSLLAGYSVLAAVAIGASDLMDALLQSMWPNLPASGAGASAAAILTAPVPLALEVALGVAVVGLIRSGIRSSKDLVVAMAVVFVPLAVLVPPTNQLWDLSAFDHSTAPFAVALRSAAPYRVLTFDPPPWYGGTPNQVALAGIDDLEMHASLSLASSNTMLDEARADGHDLALARAIGVDTVVTFGAQCPGDLVAEEDGHRAFVCHLAGALRPPYWLPRADVTAEASSPAIPIEPREAAISIREALRDAVPATTVVKDPMHAAITVVAPSSGWVFIDRSWWPFWSVKIDGQPVPALEAWSGQMVEVGQGRHTITEDLIPWDAWLGLGISVGTLLLAAIWASFGWIGARVRIRSLSLSPGTAAAMMDPLKATEEACPEGEHGGTAE